jgi:hypothetical protein
MVWDFLDTYFKAISEFSALWSYEMEDVTNKEVEKFLFI